MAPDTPLSELSFVAFDLEATGTAAGHDRIVEIAAARFRVRRGGQLVPGPVFERFVSPGERKIPEPIQELTGITPDMLAGAPALSEVLGELDRFLADEDAPTVLLAHKASADLSFLVAAGLTLERPWNGPPFACTLRVSRAVFPEAPSHRLQNLVDWLGAADAETSTFHRALADSLHTRNLFARAVARRDARRLTDLGIKAFEVPPDPADFDFDVPVRLAPLERAAREQQAVRIVYRAGSKGKRPRPVTPLAFYVDQGRVWLRAWCHLDDDVKSFRCDRIRRVHHDQAE